jgi:hypothetical protein
MKKTAVLLIAIIIVSAVALPTYFLTSCNSKEQFYFGVTYGLDSVQAAQQLIDKVQNYTNIFVIDSMPISNNESSLNAVCNYAAKKDLSFFVYFLSLYGQAWQQNWVTNATKIWSNKFLGIYLRDEPGGRQIELQERFQNATNYSDAASKFVKITSSGPSMQLLQANHIPVVTSDFALYWFDYQAGFNTIFVELGLKDNPIQQIGLCRGASNVQGKSWGAILTWSNVSEIENPAESYQNMLNAYNAGAKYLLMFNGNDTLGTPYGDLTEAYYQKMHQFWNYAASHPRDLSQTRPQAVFILPPDYGWGMRTSIDSIWGIWSTDSSSALIWQGMENLIAKYGLKLDIVYQNNSSSLSNYKTVYHWNSTAPS